MSGKVTISRAVAGSTHEPGASGRVARRSVEVLGAGAASRPRTGRVEF